MRDVYESFGTLLETFKVYKENTDYTNLPTHQISFNSLSLELENFNDIQTIMKELNEISRKLFVYGIVLESQSRVLQQLEDEFEVWEAKKYIEIDSLYPPISKAKRTETEKSNLIKTHFESEYKSFKDSIGQEKYKLGLIKRVVSSLENYGYKLHAMKDYNMTATRSN